MTDMATPCDDAEVMRLWRECELPEYFLGNGGTNHKLVAFAERVRVASGEFRRGLETAAAIADAYEIENFRLAQDTILTDPVLRDRDVSPGALESSARLRSDGHMHASMAHGAGHIAGAVRQAANGR